jgi:hypothetical protein
MGESWRHILERAAANLSIPLNGRVAGDPRYERFGQRGSIRSAPPSRSFAESRDLLARELEGISERSPRNRANHPQTPIQRTEHAGRIYRPPVTYAVTAATPETQPRRALSRKSIADTYHGLLTRWFKSRRKLVAISFFGAIMALTGYAFLSHGQAGKGGARAVERNPKQSLGTASEGDRHTASLPRKSMMSGLSQATEDILLERASYQLSQGDGAGARNTLQTLTQFGSQRGAFDLAETYDPTILARHRAWGLKADLRLARKWYKKAARLGSLVAVERLKDIEKAASPPSITTEPISKRG